MSRALAARLQMQFDRFKAFPEAGRHGEFFLVRADAWTAFLDARQLIEREVIPALHSADREKADQSGAGQLGGSFVPR